ncbi:MAG: aspartyl protease family protein [Hyphomicrobiales bacterium]
MKRSIRTASAAIAAAWIALSVAPAARASITPAAQNVVDRYLAATGGREAFLAESTLFSRYSIKAYGLTGELEVWAVRPASMASTTTLGPLTLRDATTPTSAWRMDQNGKIATLDGKERDAAMADAYFENESWALPDQGGGAVRTDEAERDSAGSYFVLEVKPPVGAERRLYFGDESGLLDHVIYAEDNETHRIRYSVYRGLTNRLRPHEQIATIDETPGSEQELVLLAVESGLQADSSAFAPPAEAGPDAFFLHGAASAQFPFEYSQHHILVQASLNGGPPETFFVDSGAGATVIDSAAAVRYGLESEGVIPATGAGAVSTASFARLDSLRLTGEDGGGVMLTGQKVVTISLSPQLEPAFWRPIAGILGYDFLSRFVVDVDFDAHRLTLYDPKSFHYEGGSPALRLEMANNIPVVEATIDGKYAGRFRIDLGSGSTIDLHGPFVKQYHLLENAKRTITTKAEGVGGMFESYTCRMKRVDIGPYNWTDPLIDLNTTDKGTFGSEDLAGNIGNQAMDRFRVTFDYEGRRLYLEPGKRYKLRDPGTIAGVRIDRADGIAKVKFVLAGTPAADAGLQAGDVVESIDGKSVASMSGDQAYALLNEAKPGTTRKLEIVRDGAKQTVKLKIRAVL